MLLQRYTSQWIRDFTDIKAELEKGLTGLECTIEHVGSTSVPNLDAKPIIDIDIIYSNPADFNRIRSGLEKIGYYYNGNQGIEDREVFKRSGTVINEVLDIIMHHLYVCPIHSQALERHLLSRDHLRANEWARATYQQMKYEIAAEVNQDRKKYAALKEERVNAFIDHIIAKEKLKTQQVNNAGGEQ